MRVIVILSLLGFGTLVYAGDAAVADLLFGNFKDQLGTGEQVEIARQSGFIAGEDGKTLLTCVWPARILRDERRGSQS